MSMSGGRPDTRAICTANSFLPSRPWPPCPAVASSALPNSLPLPLAIHFFSAPVSSFCSNTYSFYLSSSIFSPFFAFLCRCVLFPLFLADPFVHPTLFADLPTLRSPAEFPSVVAQVVRGCLVKPPGASVATPLEHTQSTQDSGSSKYSPLLQRPVSIGCHQRRRKEQVDT